jgi:hypothetical protein
MIKIIVLPISKAVRKHGVMLLAEIDHDETKRTSESAPGRKIRR